MKYIPINWDIIKSPYNWLAVSLMIVIAGLALHLIFAPQSLPTTDGSQP